MAGSQSKRGGFGCRAFVCPAQAALLSSFIGDTGQLGNCVHQAQLLGVEVLK
ncbi:MAG: hypothetical protein WA802_16300 [Terracidiphilus sp.]